jgi:hypothetical protein
MLLVRRIAYRATVLTERWLHKNAFVVGLLAGGTFTVLILLAH